MIWRLGTGTGNADQNSPLILRTPISGTHSASNYSRSAEPPTTQLASRPGPIQTGSATFPSPYHHKRGSYTRGKGIDGNNHLSRLDWVRYYKDECAVALRRRLIEKMTSKSFAGLLIPG